MGDKSWSFVKFMDTKNKNNFDVDQLFSTPLLQVDLSENFDMRSGVCDFLLNLESRQANRNTGGAQKSNVAGWRSGDDLLNCNNECLSQLASEVSRSVSFLMQDAAEEEGRSCANYEIHMYAWANINRRGAYNVVHTHPNHQWAAVYFAKAGKSDVGKPLSGQLEFSDPRPGAGLIPVENFGFGNRFRIEPKDGLLVMFPGWLPHFVHPYEGDEERISVAFNVKLQRSRSKMSS